MKLAWDTIIVALIQALAAICTAWIGRRHRSKKKKWAQGAPRNQQK
ncbi:MAG TPA: hypothetical protein VD902_05865 [Symbiobacteriaceae bacterium]|nr:hypothetical protein [Symbiobacteriaceae bacterium]